MNSTKFSQKGDTIVEVLIAVVVISSMIVGAFTIVNKSSTQIRSSQERTEAAKITTSLIEKFKYSSGPYIITPSTNWRCDTAGGPVPAGPSASDMAFTSLPVYQAANDTNSSFNADCDNNDTRYVTVYSYDDTTDVFRIVTRWDRAGGGREQLEMVYVSQ